MDNKEKERIMDLIVKEGVTILEGGPFKTSGGLSVPFYFDFRKIASNPVALEEVTKVFLKEIEKENIDVVGGIETTGIPFATAISLRTGKPMVWFRKKIRDHGLKTVISGKMPKKQDKIAVIDDSVGGGDSLNVTIENLKKEGFNISLFLTIMEGDLMRSFEKRSHFLKENQIIYFSICTWDEWTNYLLSKRKISKKLADYFYKFVENPLSFNEKILEDYKKDLEAGEIWIGKKN